MWETRLNHNSLACKHSVTVIHLKVLENNKSKCWHWNNLAQKQRRIFGSSYKKGNTTIGSYECSSNATVWFVATRTALLEITDLVVSSVIHDELHINFFYERSDPFCFSCHYVPSDGLNKTYIIWANNPWSRLLQRNVSYAIKLRLFPIHWESLEAQLIFNQYF